MPVTSNLPNGPAEISWGTAVASGAVIDGDGRGIGAGGVAAGVAACGGFAGVGAPWSCGTSAAEAAGSSSFAAESAALDAAGVADALAVLVSVPPPVPPAAAIRLCARAAGATTMPSANAKMPKHTPLFLIIILFSRFPPAGRFTQTATQARPSARTLCFVNFSVQFIVSLPAIRNVCFTARMICIWKSDSVFETEAAADSRGNEEAP